MHTLRTIMFTEEERTQFADAYVLINVSFPPESDPLARAGEGVPADDPRRRILLALANNKWEPVTRSRLVLAVETLTQLHNQVTAKAGSDYWRSRVPDRPLSSLEESMTVALTEARTHQGQQVQAALDLATAALSTLSLDDDPKVWAARHYDA